ncbi:hypothetical protein [uncultured Cohaesibacter sp.]|uniref:hypothetical protein n=1 Tax=uncultured Cohaesibacter sp. TaxID=1002546 RepID=UPI002AAC4790|nr:hypothetical protein [uncultured Cohaesibacter sp.]
MSDIEQATSIVAAGQADIVFVDESYGPQHLAKMLIPARQVEFAGGRGVCLILCSKKATAQDVLNARKLGIASLVILPTSIDTVRKHLELAARYIPQTDEELGWTKPREKAPIPTLKSEAQPPKDAESAEALSEQFATRSGVSESRASSDHDEKPTHIKGPSAKSATAANLTAAQASMKDHSPREASSSVTIRDNGSTGDLASEFAENIATSERQSRNEGGTKARADHSDPFLSNDFDVDIPALTAPRRSGHSAEEEVVFL